MSVGRAILQSVERTICLSRLAVPGLFPSYWGEGYLPLGSLNQEECGSGFFGLSVIHPLGVIVDIYRGHLRPKGNLERPTNDIPTLDPFGSRVGPY